MNATIILILFAAAAIITIGVIMNSGNNEKKDTKEQINKQVEELKAGTPDTEGAQPAINDQTLALLVEINNRLKEQGSLTLVKTIAILEVIVFAIWAIVALVGSCAIATM